MTAVQIKNFYTATENAYKTIIEYENNQSEEKKSIKEKAIEEYINNQIPEDLTSIYPGS